MHGRRHTPETIERMREAARRRIIEKPHTAPPHVGQQPFLGKTHTDEARAKISAAMRGNDHSPTGKDSPHWRGDEVGYGGLHDWMTKQYGQPVGCEDCGTTDPDKRYEWANISGEYRRDRSDFRRLCKKCHNDLDGVNVWQQPTGSG
jgi:hypothetical protein